MGQNPEPCYPVKHVQDAVCDGSGGSNPRSFEQEPRTTRPSRPDSSSTWNMSDLLLLLFLAQRRSQLLIQRNYSPTSFSTVFLRMLAASALTMAMACPRV